MTNACAATYRIAPKTFYNWARRYRQEGIDGLHERCRRPLPSPGPIPAVIEDAMVPYRKLLEERGLDNGAGVHPLGAVQGPPAAGPVAGDHLAGAGRAGLRGPRAREAAQALERFEAPAPNQCWQIDACDWALAEGTPVEIITSSTTAPGCGGPAWR